MNKKIKMYKSLLLLLLGSSLVASDGNQILYSINMPGNPFQQPYYQMMIKADNENRVYPFSTTNIPQIYTFNACNNEVGCNSYWDTPSMNVTSDYVSLYSDLGAASSVAVNNYQVSIMYGLSPYTFRGYTEGAASKLYMQRPAQVQLPFNPNPLQILNQNNTTSTVYVNATLPDYSDVFLAQTAANLYSSLGCANKIFCLNANGNIHPCTFTATTAQMPSWYTYIPRDSWWRGSSVLFYGTMASLAKPNQRQTTFSPYNEANSYSTRITMGVSTMNPTYKGVSAWDTGWILPKGVFSANGWLSSFSDNSGFVYNFPLIFAPVVSPGYAGDSQQLSNVNGWNNPINPLATVLATGDLTGNYSVLNNPYIASGNSATTYDGVSFTSGMSYFQLFAQNMQWFSLPAAQQTPLLNQKFTIPQNITPGQGIFSDAIQIAAMQAPAAISTGVPVFTGSLGVTAGITGPVVMDCAAPSLIPGDQPINFTVPQAFLSELTVNSFTVGRYLQVPGSQPNEAWSGGLSASEDPLQYYQGVTPSDDSRLNLMPYLPVYFSDPGRPVDQPGWNYCPLKNFNETSNAQMCYDTAASPMTNFYTTLTLETDVVAEQLAAKQLAAQLAAQQLAAQLAAQAAALKAEQAAAQEAAQQLAAKQLAAQEAAYAAETPQQKAAQKAAKQLAAQEAAQQLAAKQLAAQEAAYAAETPQQKAAQKAAKQLAAQQLAAQQKAAQKAAALKAEQAATQQNPWWGILAGI